MADLTTKFAGLVLSSPIVVASAGITETVERMERCQENGAGAVVMKSYFEEEVSRRSPTPRFKIIRHDMGREKTFTLFSYEQASEWDIYRYAQEVSNAKSRLHIKIIPSINCISEEGWAESARILESAGADAIELNTSCPHGSITFRGGAVEETIFRSVRIVRSAISLPIIVKLSSMLTSPIGVVGELEKIGVQGVTLFNRMTGLEIDIEEEVPIMHGGYAGHGGPWAIQYPLRWITEIRPKVSIDIAGSGGVSSWEDVVKYILAGANVVQVCTAVIMNGYEVIKELLSGLESYMDRKGYKTLDDFRGKVSTRILGTYEIDRRRRFIAHINYEDHVAPCVSACPAHVPASTYVRLIASRRFAEAVEAIRSKNPFQSVCAYICEHKCESECTRGTIDQPIAIRALKRFALEWAEENGYPTLGNNAPIMPSSGHRVAIIGAGPAGLTAAHDLVKMGHDVTVFEAKPSAGGRIRDISKMPKEILDREISYIESLGVKIEFGKALNRDLTIAELRESGFESYLIATGAGSMVEQSSRLSTEPISMEGLFFTGDVIRKAGERSVIHAVADGKRSAIHIDHYLKGKADEPIPQLRAVDKRLVLIRSIEEPSSPRVENRSPDGKERTFTEEEARREAERCLSCGCGVGCDRCYQVCIYSGVKLESIRYVIDKGKCDGCGLCAEICPSMAISMVPVH